MEQNQENNETNPTEESAGNKAKFWIQDNMRIIISILIVVLIAGGIYSYSKRAGESSNVSENETIDMEELATETEEGEGTEAGQETDTQTSKPEETQPAANETAKSETSSIASSQETENSFVETAVSGDSRTTLARKALANYLEKNPDSALKPEHKIYIEDYLRKHVKYNGNIRIGTSVEFSKDLIKSAIESSKTLNEGQLQNLQKYVVRVPSLS